LTQRGKRGDSVKGDKGDTVQGKPGAQPIALKFDGEAMQFVMALDSGEVLEADFGPVAEAIVQSLRND
jgi:hypothetical protein